MSDDAARRVKASECGRSGEGECDQQPQPARTQDGEQELAELEAEQKRLGNADTLIRLCQQSLGLLYEQDEGSVGDQLARVQHWLGDAVGGDGALTNALNTVESARLQVEAAADDLRHYLDRLDLDPRRDIAQRQARRLPRFAQCTPDFVSVALHPASRLRCSGRG